MAELFELLADGAFRRQPFLLAHLPFRRFVEIVEVERANAKSSFLRESFRFSWSVVEVFENAVEFDVHGGENLGIDPIFDRHREKDGFEGCRFGRQSEGFMEVLEADFASAVQSTWNCVMPGFCWRGI